MAMVSPDQIEVGTVAVGRIEVLRRRRNGEPIMSAIMKRPVDGNIVEITEYGIVGDEHADPSVHGGLEKAIYAYPFVHYASWEDDLHLIDSDPIFRTGELSVPAFGENLSLLGGIDETMVRIGDLFDWGSAQLRVTKPRQPCHKFDAVMGKGAGAMMKKNGRCGWYFAVERRGKVDITTPLVFLGHDMSGFGLLPTVREAFNLKMRSRDDL